MVLKILSYPREIMKDSYTGLLQHSARPDAGPLQQMRCSNRSGRYKHLSVGTGDMALALMVVFNAGCTFAIQEDAAGHCVSDDCQIGT
jgi:hypothetical protein